MSLAESQGTMTYHHQARRANSSETSVQQKTDGQDDTHMLCINQHKIQHNIIAIFPVLLVRLVQSSC